MGDYATVLRWWRYDKAAARHPIDASGRDVIQRALVLFRGGHISRAVRMLTSAGLVDLTDERILGQLTRKHPAIKEAIAEVDSTVVPAPRLSVSLRGTLAQLDEESAAGVSGEAQP